MTEAERKANKLNKLYSNAKSIQQDYFDVISDKYMSEIKIRQSKIKDKLGKYKCKYHQMVEEMQVRNRKDKQEIEVEEYLFKDKICIDGIGAHLKDENIEGVGKGTPLKDAGDQVL